MPAIDESSIERLQSVLGDDLPEIIAEIAESMRQSTDGVETAIAARDLEETALVARRCRNDALMVGARLLLKPLERLEDAARAGDLEGARTAAIEVSDSLPETLQALERVAAR
jgi:HPt (histidine-containing phosphotransfer) domain-containing protein